ARIYGYNEIPTHSIISQLAAPNDHNQLSVQQITNLLVDRGYREVISYSFIDPQLQQLFNFEHAGIDLLNPISPEHAQMRMSLWPGLLMAVVNNQNRQHQDMRLFEEGLCFYKEGGEIRQQAMIAGIVVGRASVDQWGQADRDFDYYDLKADIEAIAQLTHAPEALQYNAEAHPALHPGQTAVIKQNGLDLGWIGGIHPRLTQQLDINGPVYAFELKVEALQKIKLNKFKPLSKFPAIRRDISFIIDKNVTAQQIENIIIQSANECLQKLFFFDVYYGEGITKGKKSVAIGLIFQHYSRTLTDTEIINYMNDIISDLNEAYAISLRN
ncbi:MAG: phenylalanine--tRNA ligase subunit beta, partial [Gammaproteobacteria bacterium]